MSVDGTYNIVINSPMGAQKVTLTLKDAGGGTLTGSQAGAQGTMDIAAGKVDGNKISGNVKAGAFGSFPFSGERA